MQDNSYLRHHGIKGQKWGRRRFQNPDGTWTEAGKKRYGNPTDGNSSKKAVGDYNRKSDDWEKAQDIADSKKIALQEAYKKTGSNFISRVLNNIKGTSDAVKEYNKKYDDWEKAQDLADSKLSDVKEAYKKTGSNFVSRVVNNFKYRDAKGIASNKENTSLVKGTILDPTYKGPKPKNPVKDFLDRVNKEKH